MNINYVGVHVVADSPILFMGAAARPVEIPEPLEDQNIYSIRKKTKLREDIIWGVDLK